MQNKKIITLGLILLSVILLITAAITYIPVSRIEKNIDFTIINPDPSDPDLPTDLPIYLSEELRVLRLTYPQWLWLGDPQFITLSIQPKANDSTLQSSAESSQIKYHVYLEARLDLGLVSLLSGDTVTEAVNANQPVQFLWKVEAEIHGMTKGNLWLFVNITDSKNGDTWQLTRFALPLQIESKKFIGLPLSSARTLTLIGFILVFSAGLVLLLFQPRNSKNSGMI